MNASTREERVALYQKVTPQPDGPGLRVGKRGEIVAIVDVAPGGAKLFKERIGAFQEEAWYWEDRVGTVHDFRIVLIDNETRLMFLITYDGDFKPYVHDIISQAAPWFDALMPGVWANYTTAEDPKTVELLLTGIVTSSFFYCSHPELTVHDITRMKKLSRAFGEMLDAQA